MTTTPPSLLRFSPATWRHLGLASLLIGCVFLLFHFFGVTDVGYDIKDTTRSVFDWMYDRWYVDLLQTKFAHSHLVPLISLWLVWRERRVLARLPKRMFLPGLALVLLALVFHWAGAKAQQTRLSILGLMLLTWALPLFICGPAVARRLIFPCGFLFFSLPLNFFDAAAYPLRIIAAALAGGISAGLGIDLVRSGAVLALPEPVNATLSLADTRSGIYAITAAVAWCILVAHLARVSWLRKGVLAALSLPLIVAANVVRGLIGTLTAAVAGGPAAEAVYAAVSGPVILLVAFALPAVLGWRWSRRTPRVVVIPPGQPEASRGTETATALAIVLVLAATWWIPTNLTIVHLDEAGVNLDLPAEIGAWSGGVVLFCHNPADAGEKIAPGLAPGDACPDCGEPLQEMSVVERALLPPDTTVRKNRYVRENGSPVYLSIVLSGKDRSSIHRPEVCLVGPNSQIAHRFVHRVPLKGGGWLDVKVLEMLLTYRTSGGEVRTATSYYAYWFAGIGQETPSHYERMWWMARDRLFRNRSHRWAYISLAGHRPPEGRAYLAEVDAFLAAAHPALIQPR